MRRRYLAPSVVAATAVLLGAELRSQIAPSPTLPGSERRHDVQELWRRAQQLIRSARIDEAIGVLERLIELDPDALNGRVSLCRLYRARGRLREAQAHLREVLRRDPHNVAAHSELACVQVNAGYPEQALGMIELVLEAAPLATAALVAKAEALFKLQRLAECESLAEHLLEVDPDRYEAHYWLGMVALAKKSRTPAIFHLRRCLEIQNRVGFDPNIWVDACETLADTYFSLGRYPQAVTMFEQVLPFTEKKFDAHLKIGLAHCMNFHYERAEMHLGAALEIDPESYPARIRYAWVFDSQELLDRALLEYRKAAVLKPAEAFIHERIGNVLLRMERLAEAKSELKTALALGPFNAWPFTLLAKVLRQEGEHDEAARYLEQGIALDPLHVEAYYLLSQILPRTSDPEGKEKARKYGEIYMKLSPKKGDIAKYQMMLEISPAFVEARVVLAGMLDLIGQSDAALGLLATALEISPQHVGVRVRRAAILIALGRILEARRDLVEAKELLEQRLGVARETPEPDAALQRQVEEDEKELRAVEEKLKELQERGSE
ncbi:MAG: tetratricopeptide repeat protein [Planctomycetota bacterium]